MPGTITIWGRSECVWRQELLRVAYLGSMVEKSTRTNWGLEFLGRPARWNHFINGKGCNMCRIYLISDCFWTQVEQDLYSGMFNNTRFHWRLITSEQQISPRRVMDLIELQSFIHETCQLVLEVVDLIFEMGGEASYPHHFMELTDTLCWRWIVQDVKLRCQFTKLA